ncbi:hypothetical protein HaLaN_18028 [Haematococcus lacustris]|uniref:Uncharacterized protein n=1 Tax=Haematococcus lacustris TaxID=44745 RepID=A0A699ZDQ5_HAELA|nr:hypothetical protein HaLaN_18028 [Haematococcus lacustris]
MPASSTGWVEIHVEGEATSYRSGQSLGQVTAQMAEFIKACDNLIHHSGAGRAEHAPKHAPAKASIPT